MKKTLILAGLIIILAGSAMAQTWSYAWPNNTISKSFDSLVMVTTVTDTTVKYYFKKNNTEAQVWLDHRAKNATLTTIKIPLIEYKWVDGAGNSYSPDSANGWIKLADSSHVTISAAAHTYQKKLLSNKTGIRGVIFKGTIAAAESTVSLIRVTE